MMIICDTHCDTLNMRALHKDETPCVTMENMVRKIYLLYEY